MSQIEVNALHPPIPIEDMYGTDGKNAVIKLHRVQY